MAKPWKYQSRANSSKACSNPDTCPHLACTNHAPYGNIEVFKGCVLNKNYRDCKLCPNRLK